MYNNFTRRDMKSRIFILFRKFIMMKKFQKRFSCQMKSFRVKFEIVCKLQLSEEKIQLKILKIYYGALFFYQPKISFSFQLFRKLQFYQFYFPCFKKIFYQNFDILLRIFGLFFFIKFRLFSDFSFKNFLGKDLLSKKKLLLNFFYPMFPILSIFMQIYFSNQ